MSTFPYIEKVQFSKLDLFPSSSGMVSKYSVGPAAEKSFICQSQLIRYAHISDSGSGFSFENIMFFLNTLQWRMSRYEACLESKDTKVLNMYSIFNLQKRHCE